MGHGDMGRLWLISQNGSVHDDAYGVLGWLIPLQYIDEYRSLMILLRTFSVVVNVSRLLRHSF